MVNKILQMLSIRCAHKKLSQPFAASPSTPRRSGSNWDTPSAPSAHYVVCLDCGRKFEYDWSKMRMMGR